MFAGTYTALITPFRDGQVDYDGFRKLIEAQIAGGVDGIVPVGTTGESPTLSHDEHRDVIKAAVEIAAGRVKVVGGTGSNSTDEAIGLTQDAEKAGADGALVVAPYYNKPSPEGLYRHFRAIAENTKLPIILYSIPGRCGIEIGVPVVARLAKDCPNIVAIKEATGSLDSASEIRRRCALPILSGDDSLTIGFQSVGAIGVVSVVSNLVPDRVQSLVEACNRNDFDSARATHESLLPLAKGLLSLDVNPVPVKTAMAMLGRDSGALRLPLCAPSDAVKRQIGELLKAQGLAAAPQAVRA